MWPSDWWTVAGANVVTMTDIDATRKILTDAFGRVREGVAELTDGLSDETVGWQPLPGANSIAWLLWHLSRVQDDHLADAAGTDQIWLRYRDEFALPLEADDTGFGHSAEQVARVRVPADLLARYHADVHTATIAYLDQLTTKELDRVIDRHWDPPVTVAVRLVSVIDDCAKHLGQAEYVRGLAVRRNGGSTSPEGIGR